ncbi:hypothetical protein L9F63_017435, partial [Diploptera punctata]
VCCNYECRKINVRCNVQLRNKKIDQLPDCSNNRVRWAGRVAVVTGASSGIGAAISQELVKKGLKVVGLARRVERVEILKSQLVLISNRKLYPVKADITKDTDVKDAFKWIKSNLGGVDILINNAGVNIGNSLTDWQTETYENLLILSLSNCTKEAVQSMKDRGVDDGHIVHINSLLGHVIPPAEYSLFMYTATKHAVTMLAEGLRRELVSQKSKIRVTSVSPGLVNTEFTTVSSADYTPETLHESHPHLQPQDLADAVLYVLGTPPHVQVHELTLRPTGTYIKMDRLEGRVAVVTGASSGIGAAIAEELVKRGLKVVGLARRVEKIEELAAKLKSEKGELHALKCDVTIEEEIKKSFEYIKIKLGGVHILINNAGVMIFTNTMIEEWRNMLDINVLALSICTRESIKLMKETDIDDGHIIHINSICGHSPPSERIVMYAATKHAVTALTEGLRRELITQNSKIRVSSISPGMVKTEMPPKSYLENMTSLNPEDIADAVVYVLGTPQHVQVHELTIRPTGNAIDNVNKNSNFSRNSHYEVYSFSHIRMERWTGRVAVVTGANSGIGAATAKKLVIRGLKVVGLGLTIENIEDLYSALSEKGELHGIKCDVTKETDVKKAFQWVKNKFGGVDILINCAAVSGPNSIIE